MPERIKIIVDVTAQQLFVLHKQQVIQQYSVSTATKGTGQQNGSEQTPLGNHKIHSKLGGNVPINGVFVGREFTGEIYSAELSEQHPKRDWILTRILWLTGLEPGFNQQGEVDSLQRYIYIHGTPDSEPMGIPKSHGCIRMRNSDLIKLFQQIEIGTEVEIKA